MFRDSGGGRGRVQRFAGRRRKVFAFQALCFGFKVLRGSARGSWAAGITVFRLDSRI